MIKGLDHIGICVSDLKKSVDFYCNILGFKIIDHTGFDESYEAAVAMHMDSCCVDAAIIEKDGVQLEMLEFRDKAPSRASKCPMNSVGKLHISLRTDDIEEDIYRLKEAGVEFYGNYLVDRMADDGDKWVYFKDPDGNALELTERTGKLEINLNTSI